MASDKPTSAANAPDCAAQQLPMLVVDPVVLEEAAQLLKELPEPHSPRAGVPTAEAVGDRTLTDAIETFHRQYRAVASALAEDNKITSTHLAGAADAYRRVETRIAAILTDAAEFLPDTSDNDRADSTRPDGAEPDDNGHDDSQPGDRPAQDVTRRIREALEV